MKEQQAFTRHQPAESPLMLKTVLDRYYRVSGRAFDDCDAIQICKHQVLHLAKLNRKLLEYWLHQSPPTTAVAATEVTPDLIIYAQELMMKFGHKWWSSSHKAQPETANAIRTLLELESRLADLNEVVISVSKATAALADICDQSDHSQMSSFEIERDVIVPFLCAAATLQQLLGLDLEATYSNRLEDMRRKYERWR
jgi:hypothetical protein